MRCVVSSCFIYFSGVSIGNHRQALMVVELRCLLHQITSIGLYYQVLGNRTRPWKLDHKSYSYIKSLFVLDPCDIQMGPNRGPCPEWMEDLVDFISRINISININRYRYRGKYREPDIQHHHNSYLRITRSFNHSPKPTHATHQSDPRIVDLYCPLGSNSRGTRLER